LGYDFVLEWQYFSSRRQPKLNGFGEFWWAYRMVVEVSGPCPPKQGWLELNIWKNIRFRCCSKYSNTFDQLLHNHHKSVSHYNVLLYGIESITKLEERNDGEITETVRSLRSYCSIAYKVCC
jgi:hypothetical protein